MRVQQSITLVMLGVSLFVVAACQDFQPSKNSDFKSKYMVARGALEEGSYARAGRNYQALLKQSGPLEPRVRLEYAHALLRANKFEEASNQARIITQRQSGDARIAALAVQGTADHELARAAIGAGQRDATVKRRLQSARTALGEVGKHGKDFDPLGAMAERRKEIDRTLSAL